MPANQPPLARLKPPYSMGPTHNNIFLAPLVFGILIDGGIEARSLPRQKIPERRRDSKRVCIYKDWRLFKREDLTRVYYDAVRAVACASVILVVTRKSGKSTMTQKHCVERITPTHRRRSLSRHKSRTPCVFVCSIQCESPPVDSSCRSRPPRPGVHMRTSGTPEEAEGGQG